MNGATGAVSELLQKAVQHHNAGQLQEASALYRQLLELEPDRFEALNLCAMVDYRLGDAAAALVLIRRAISIKSDNAETHNLCGVILRKVGQLDEAVDAFRRSLDISPDYFDASFNLGDLLQAQGKLDGALEYFSRALAIRPDHARTLYCLGNVLRELGKPADAADCYRRAVALRPRHAGAHNNLGNVLQELGKLDEAVECYCRAIDIEPDHAGAYNNMGNIFQEQGKLYEAVDAYRKCLELDPGLHHCLASLITCCLSLCRWTDLAELTSALYKVLQSDRPGVPPLMLLPIFSDGAEIRKASEAWARSTFKQASDKRFKHGPGRDPRITVGYLSVDFRNHVVARQIVELFENHDRERFRVHGYSLGPDDGTAERKRIVQAFDRFTDMREMSWNEAAATIHGDGVDILVDLAGYTEHSRTQIVMLRPAPVQVNYLGYPGTMAADFMDYIIADSYLIPHEFGKYYTEEVVYLPDCYQVNPSARPVSDRFLTRQECGLPDKGFVFAAFHNPNKILPEVFRVWMNLLRAVEGSVLWLSTRNTHMASNLRKETHGRGIDPDRLIFSSRQLWPDYMNFYRHVDLFLDTFPYNSGGTAADAVWMGCPIVTCSGESYVSRMAGSILHAVGVPELITGSLDEYESLSLRLSTRPEELGALRKKIEENRATSGLFDCKRFTGNIEKAYLTMWKMFLRGEPPRSFQVYSGCREFCPNDL